MKKKLAIWALVCVLLAGMVTVSQAAAHDHASSRYSISRTLRTGHKCFAGSISVSGASCSFGVSATISHQISATFGLSSGVFQAATGYTHGRSTSYSTTVNSGGVPRGKCLYVYGVKVQPGKRVSVYDYHWYVTTYHPRYFGPQYAWKHTYKGRTNVYQGDGVVSSRDYFVATHYCGF